MISSILKATGVSGIVSALSKVFKNHKSEKLQKAGAVLEEISAVFSNGDISAEDQEEIHRHMEEVLKIESEMNADIISEINQSIRAEIASEDKYVRHMRPTFGYLMAITWAAQMLAVAYVMIFETQNAGFLIEAVGALSPIWAVGLSVLGIYVYKRSEDKRIYRQKH
jgi:hypothetical protein